MGEIERVKIQSKLNSSNKLGSHDGHSFLRTQPSNGSDVQLSIFTTKFEKGHHDMGPSKITSQTWKKSVKRNLNARKILNGRRYKKLLRLRAQKPLGAIYERDDKLPQENCTVTKLHGCDEADIRVSGSKNSIMCAVKMERADTSQKEQTCPGMAEFSESACIKTPVMKERNVEDIHELKAQKGRAYHLHVNKFHDNMDIQMDQDECVICRRSGKLLSCLGRGCRRSFHLDCINPPLSFTPPGVWHCMWCVRKKIKSGVYSVSLGIESILDARDILADNEEFRREKQYLVKYKGLAHVHNCWIPEGQLLLEAPMLLTKFKKHNQKVDWKTDWSILHRVLEKRLIIFPEDSDNFGGHGGYRYEWLVKWRGLTYEYATWELESESFLRSPEGMKLINEYEHRHQREAPDLCSSKEGEEGQKTDQPEFSEASLTGSSEVCNDHLMYVNKLHQTWLRQKNAVVIDEQGRMARVVLFILSLQKVVNQPSLVITTSSCLSQWEAEFSRWMPSANVVVYQGNRGVRATIRTLEFYNKSGCIMFQVLLSTSDAVIKDQDFMESLNWAAIVIDECQRPSVALHLNHIKMLPASMRLLLITGHVKDSKSNYHNIVSFLDPEYDKNHGDTSDFGANNDSSKLKEKMMSFLAYRCQVAPSRFVEYWVPVQLSNVQREQYCASFLSKSTLLCSSSKTESLECLHDILLLSQKCCDHPYLVDSSLRSSVIEGISMADQLDAEIEISGKLKLLAGVLREIRKRGLRVLILFQNPGGSGYVSIGDILDDFIHQKYGNSYARIDGVISRQKQRAAANLFNNDRGKFVCLIETRACVSSIKLRSVDTIILFDSNWDPLNDLRSLQKITIDSQFEQLKVFRLYTSCTLEEGILDFARQGMSIDCSLRNIKHSTCQKILSWGAAYQFSLLNYQDGFHEPASSNTSCGQTLFEDVLTELSVLLPNNGENSHSFGCKVVSEVRQSDGAYSSDIYLLGELITQSTGNLSSCHLSENESHRVFWSNLLQSRQPRWTYLPNQSSKVRRKVQLLSSLAEESELGGQGRKKSRKETDDIANLSAQNSKLKLKQKHNVQSKKRKSGPFQPLDGNKSRHINSEVRQKGRPLSGENTRNVCDHSNTAGLPTPAALPAERYLDSLGQDNFSPFRQEHDSGHPIDSFVQPNASSDTLLQHGPMLVDGNGQDTESLGGTNAALETETNHPLDSSPLISEMAQYDMPVGGIVQKSVDSSINPFSDRELNHHYIESSQVTAEVPQSACPDPLQRELDKIQRDKELTMNLHEGMKLQLQCECEKEIDGIRKKYDLLLKNAETEFMRKKEDLETSYNQVYVNKLLAGAMMQKHSSAYATAGSEGTQKDAQLVAAEGNPLEVDQAVTRCTGTAEASLANPYRNISPPVTSVEVVNSPSRDGDTVTSELRVAESPMVTKSSGNEEMQGKLVNELNPTGQIMTLSPVRSPGHRGQLSIPTIHYRADHQVGCVVRGPAPHLRNSAAFSRDIKLEVRIA